MNKRDLAYELSSYNRREIVGILKAALSLKKYHRLTEEEPTLEETIEELEK